jgi:hypothetical protein
LHYVGLVFLRGADGILGAYVFLYVISLKARSRKVLFLDTFGAAAASGHFYLEIGGVRQGPVTTPASIDSGELGLAPIAGAALLRLASSAKANPGPMPKLPESAAAKVKKKPKSMTHRRIPPRRQFAALQKTSLPNLSQLKCALSVLSNNTERVTVNTEMVTVNYH